MISITHYYCFDIVFSFFSTVKIVYVLVNYKLQREQHNAGNLLSI